MHLSNAHSYFHCVTCKQLIFCSLGIFNSYTFYVYKMVHLRSPLFEREWAFFSLKSDIEELCTVRELSQNNV